MVNEPRDSRQEVRFPFFSFLSSSSSFFHIQITRARVRNVGFLAIPRDPSRSLSPAVIVRSVATASRVHRSAGSIEVTWRSSRATVERDRPSPCGRGSHRDFSFRSVDDDADSVAIACVALAMLIQARAGNWTIVRQIRNDRARFLAVEGIDRPLGRSGSLE